MSHNQPVIFVVDDDISVRESIGMLIRSLGWRPEIFATAQEFLSFPLVRAPSCLVLDIELPDLNGLELQQLVASLLPGVPVIVITGLDHAPLMNQAMKAGAFEFLVKPFESERLLSAIDRAIKRSNRQFS